MEGNNGVGYPHPPTQQGNVYPNIPPTGAGYPNAPPPKYDDLNEAPVTVVTHSGK